MGVEALEKLKLLITCASGSYLFAYPAPSQFLLFPTDDTKLK